MKNRIVTHKVVLYNILFAHVIIENVIFLVHVVIDRTLCYLLPEVRQNKLGVKEILRDDQSIKNKQKCFYTKPVKFGKNKSFE